MSPTVRELMEEFPEALVIVGADDQILFSNEAARVTSYDVLADQTKTDGPRVIRFLRPPCEFPHPESEVLNGSNSLILTNPAASKFAYIGDAAAESFNFAPEIHSLDFSHLLSRIHTLDREFIRAKLKDDALVDHSEYDFRVVTQDGRVRWMRAHHYPLVDDKTKDIFALLVLHDISGIRAAKLRPIKSFARVANQPPGTPKLLRQKLEESVQLWKRDPRGHFFAVAFVDLVRFRAINDSIGYEAGDRLLVEFFRRIRASIGGGDTLVRFGADQVAVLISSVKDRSHAEHLIRKILRDLHDPYDAGQLQLLIGSRAGLAFPRSHDTSADSILRDVDSAHQEARLKREAFVVASETSTPRSHAHIALEADLAQALLRDEFFFEYQPVFEPKTGRVRLLEALLRWRHPRLGVISPNSFISLAEDSGLVINLDMKGLARLERQALEWRASYPALSEIPLSLNISGRHFPNFVLEKQFHQLLQRPSLRQSRIVFEITESVFVEGTAQTVAGLQRLREAGVQIWLDDFGEGYSSFRYLNHFQVDGIKISECFVRTCAEESRSRLILSALFNLGRGMGVQVVAEGVETREQFDTLVNMGFDALQGFYLARPMAASEIPSLLLESGMRFPALPRSA